MQFQDFETFRVLNVVTKDKFHFMNATNELVGNGKHSMHSNFYTQQNKRVQVCRKILNIQIFEKNWKSLNCPAFVEMYEIYIE